MGKHYIASNLRLTTVGTGKPDLAGVRLPALLTPLSFTLRAVGGRTFRFIQRDTSPRVTIFEGIAVEENSRRRSFGPVQRMIDAARVLHLGRDVLYSRSVFDGVMVWRRRCRSGYKLRYGRPWIIPKLRSSFVQGERLSEDFDHAIVRGQGKGTATQPDASDAIPSMESILTQESGGRCNPHHTPRKRTSTFRLNACLKPCASSTPLAESFLYRE